MSFPRQPFDFFSERQSKVFTLHTFHRTLRTPNLKLHTPNFTLHTSHFTLHTSHFPLLPSHSKPHTSHCALRTPNLNNRLIFSARDEAKSSHSTLHTALFALRTWNFTLHTSHFTLRTSHFTLPTASFTLQTSHFTLRASHSKLKLHTPHFTLLTSHCFLHTSHFTLHTSHCFLHTPTPEQKKLILNRKWKQPKSERSFFCHMYAIRSWFLVWFVTTHTETKMKWHRHSAVCNSKWKAKLLKHSNSDSDAVHNNAHPALGSQTRIDPSAAIPRTVAVQDVEPFCALSFGSVATQSVPETSAFSNGPNLNFWRSSHSPQVALQRRLDHAGRGTQLRTSSSGRQGSCYCGFCEASE